MLHVEKWIEVFFCLQNLVNSDWCYKNNNFANVQMIDISNLGVPKRLFENLGNKARF